MKRLVVALGLGCLAALSCGGGAASFGPERVEIPTADGLSK